MDEYSVLVSRDDSDGNLQFLGTAQSAAAHRWGMPHTTVLLVPAVHSAIAPTRLVMHRRSPLKRSSPNCLDFCGGHASFSERFFIGKPWESGYDLEAATANTAYREANEEIRCGQPPMHIDSNALLRFGSLGHFDCHVETNSGANVEYSTCYILAIPAGPIRIFDTDQAGERELPAQLLSLAEILEHFRTNAADFADGASRILGKLAHDPILRLKFEELVAKAVLQDGTAR